MFLIFGCDNLITHEELVPNQDGDDMILATKVDREETLRVNANYYPDIYGDDYFIDDSDIEIETLDAFEDEDDIEFEWTMLEMELAAEAEDEEDEFEDEGEDEFYDDEYDEELNGMNPEEMLKYIRGE